jgi:hypothetical protein
MVARLAPDFVSLNPGYACCRRSTAALAAATAAQLQLRASWDATR